MSGFVSLVGAGPGDPDLLTVRAARALAAADIVFYDALVAREVLDLAPRAQRFGVGKRGGRPSMRQETINRLLVRSARRGKRVVRLKGGDPFVLGRGGEEALALVAAGVPFEVVPGVSSAVAAPALSGIPVTHRGLASAFVVVSGHAEEAWRPVLAGLSPGTLTVVVLMGLASRAAIAAALVARGWAPSTPAAILWGAGTPASRPLDRDPGRPRPGRRTAGGAAGAPGTIVVGAVVGLAERPRRRAVQRVGRGRSRRPSPPAWREDRMHARSEARRSAARGCRSPTRPRSTSSSATLESLRARRAHPRPVARLPPRARHLRPAPGGRRADAAGQDPPGDPRRAAARGPGRRGRALVARLRPRHHAPERPVPLHEAARRRARPAPAGRGRAHHPRGLRQLRPERDRLPVRGGGARTRCST